VGFFILPKKRKEIIIMTKQEREIILEQINYLAKINNKIMNTLDNDLFFSQAIPMMTEIRQNIQEIRNLFDFIK
jgi:hypothetical protein